MHVKVTLNPNQRIQKITLNRGVAGKDAPADNITAYGAIPGGVFSANDAIAQALAAHGSAYIPKGTFLVSAAPVTGGRIHGPGTLIKTADALCALKLLGTRPRVEGVSFASTLGASNAHAEINLGDGCVDPVVRGCMFLGSIYSCINGDANGADDSSLVYATPARGIVLDQNQIAGSYSRHVYLHSVEDGRIINNTFKNSKRDSIRLRQATGRFVISSNFFKDIGEPSLYNPRPANWSSLISYTLGQLASIPTGDAPGVYECIVANSTVGANPATTGSAEWVNRDPGAFETKDAIDAFWSGKELSITNNIVQRTESMAFDVKGSAPDGSYSSGKVIISGNIIQDCYASGINVHAADLTSQGFKYVGEYVINSNYLKGNNREAQDLAQAAITIKYGARDVSISDNMVVQNFSRGIQVGNAENMGICKNIKITGNHILSNGIANNPGNVGLNVGPVDGLVIHSNIIKNLDGDATQITAMNLKDFEQVGANVFVMPTRSAIVKDNLCRGTGDARFDILVNNAEPNALLAYVDSDNTGNATAVVPMLRRLFAGGADSGASTHLHTQAFLLVQGITLRARVLGAIGNLLSFAIEQQTGADQPLRLTIAPAIFGGREMIAKLPTDGAGNPAPVTVEALESFLKQKLMQGFLTFENGTSQPPFVPASPLMARSGSRGTPNLVAEGGSLTLSNAARQMLFVAGNGAAVTALIPDGWPGLDEITVIGTSDLNPVQLAHGGNLELNGNCILKNGSTIRLLWDGLSKWVEGGRNDL